MTDALREVFIVASTTLILIRTTSFNGFRFCASGAIKHLCVLRSIENALAFRKTVRSGDHKAEHPKHNQTLSRYAKF